MLELFHERAKKARGEYPTTFQYEELPTNLRQQIVQNVKTIINEYNINAHRFGRTSYLDELIVLAMRESLGREKITDNYTHFDELKAFIISETDIENVLSALELTMIYSFKYVDPGPIVNRINRRFKQAGIGYQICDSGHIIRIEDELFFDNVTIPCLSILSQNKYQNVYDQYQKAYSEYKKGDLFDAVTDCSKAIESIVKIRLKEIGIEDIEDIEDIENRRWLRLKPLIREHLSIPSYMNSYRDNLLNLIEGVITIRNKEGAHGKSDQSQHQLTDASVRFVLNQMSANLLFLAEAEFK